VCQRRSITAPEHAQTLREQIVTPQGDRKELGGFTVNKLEAITLRLKLFNHLAVAHSVRDAENSGGVRKLGQVRTVMSNGLARR
jgi:hypothetical protein